MALEVKGVVAGYSREVSILNGVDLYAADGLVTLILGPNGAGKSTLLKTIFGYLRPRAGEIRLDGQDLANLSPKDMLRHGLAYLPQGCSVFPAMTVEENLELGGWILRGRGHALEASFTEVYARFPRLKERRHSAAGLLSGGEQRMLEIARLTVTRPRILLLDEPSVGLMPKLVDEIYAEIAKLKDEKFTIVIVDQNVKKAIEIADYAYSLTLGRNSHQGPQQEFKGRLPEIIKEWL
jgi:branched-chain amino acid transport system ATP-binding protein